MFKLLHLAEICTSTSAFWLTRISLPSEVIHSYHYLYYSYSLLVIF